MTPTLAGRIAARDRPKRRTHVMYQTWQDLLFLHWSFDPAIIQSTLPAGLTVDTWKGKAYLGIVPFLMRNIRPRFFPAVRSLSNFHEINLRTYVFDKTGMPGVWFYSLDADQWLAVRVARSLFQLPYFDAAMSHTRSESNRIRYASQRKSSQHSPSVFDYEIGQSIGTAKPGTFQFFLAERYLLFAQRRSGQLYSGQVIHEPYPLFEACLNEWDPELIKLAGFDSPQEPPEHVLFSSGVDVDVFALQSIE